jgi:hypothetical protein
MAKKRLNYYLLKLARLSGWLLLPLVLTYLVTGFRMCNHFGLHHLIDRKTATEIHRLFEWPLVSVFLLHASTTIYFALRRWGWIKNRPCK